MMRMFALCSLLAASALLAECSFIKRSPTSAPEMSCQASIYETCLGSIQYYSFFLNSEQAIASAVGNIQFLESLSGDLNTMADCIDQELTTARCEGVTLATSGWDSIRLMANYLDNSTRREIIVAASSSPCVSNPELVKTAAMPLFNCYMTSMQQAQQDMCQGLAQLESCTVREASLICGPGGGLFIQSVWDFLEHPQNRVNLLNMVEMGEMAALVSPCYPQVNAVQQLTKRAMKAMRK